MISAQSMFNNSISQFTVTSYENNSSTEACGYIIKTKTGVRNCCQKHLYVIPGHSPYRGKRAVCQPSQRQALKPHE